MQTNIKSLKEFIKNNSLKLKCEKINTKTDFNCIHNWKCILFNTKTKKQMTIYFRTIDEKEIKPTLIEILPSLIMDCNISDLSFEEWCNLLKYDYKNKNYKKIYNNINNRAEGLKRILNNEQYNILCDIIYNEN